MLANTTGLWPCRQNDTPKYGEAGPTEEQSQQVYDESMLTDARGGPPGEGLQAVLNTRHQSSALPASSARAGPGLLAHTQSAQETGPTATYFPRAPAAFDQRDKLTYPRDTLNHNSIIGCLNTRQQWHSNRHRRLFNHNWLPAPWLISPSSHTYNPGQRSLVMHKPWGLIGGCKETNTLRQVQTLVSCINRVQRQWPDNFDHSSLSSRDAAQLS